MKTELQRHREAVEVAQAFICVMRKSCMLSQSRREELAIEYGDRINSILNPPPEFETVELVEWAILRPRGSIDHFDDEDSAVRCRDNHHNGCPIVKLTGTYTRPKPPKVEMSGKLSIFNDGSYCLEANDAIPGAKFGTRGIEMEGTFTWQEG